MTGHGDRDPLLELLGGKVRAQAVSTAAELGLADALSDGPLPLEELARRAGCRPEPLASLARLLTGLGVFAQPEPGLLALTDLGRRLRRDELGPLAAFVGSREQWDPWSRLRDSVRGGACAFERTFDQGLYARMADDPEAARRYDAAIDAFTRLEAAALSERYDFSGARHVVDVGGGHGALLEELLARWPHLRGTLFDLPHVTERAAERLAARFAGRAAVASGDFLESVPPGADHYLVKYVLHNWSDERAARILAACAAALPPKGRILVIEAVLAPDGRADLAALLDLEMLVLTGGRERRKPELRRLFKTAGLRVERMEPLTAGTWLSVLEA